MGMGLLEEAKILLGCMRWDEKEGKTLGTKSLDNGLSPKSCLAPSVMVWRCQANFCKVAPFPSPGNKQVHAPRASAAASHYPLALQ